jgi:phospholipase A1/A2
MFGVFVQRAAVTAALFGLWPIAASAEIRDILDMSSGPCQAGSDCDVTIYVTNDGSDAVEIQVQAEIGATLGVGDSAVPVHLTLRSSETEDAVLRPGQFRRLVYTFRAPDTIIGPSKLTLIAPAKGTVYLVVERPGPPSSPPEAVASGDRVVPSSEYELGMANGDEPGHVNAFLRNLSVYEPIYFLVGASPADAKFQLSFKYRLFRGKDGAETGSSILNGLYLAYTQTSFWDLHAPSKPFTDSSFRPELFYRTHLTSLGHRMNGADVDLQVGIQHESNGKSGADSRSFNVIYLKPSIAFPLPDDLTLAFAGQLWGYVGSLSDNPNIGDYRGHASLLASFGYPKGLMLTGRVRGGITSGKGNVMVDASYPLSAVSFSSLDLYLYTQFYRGYGEDLLDYNKKDTSFRIGFGLVR